MPDPALPLEDQPMTDKPDLPRALRLANEILSLQRKGCRYNDYTDGEVETLILALLAEHERAERLAGALLDATAHLAGAASAYRKYGRRYKARGPADPFFTTRAADFEAGAERARAALKEGTPNA